VIRIIEDNAARGLAPASVVTIGNFDGLHLGHQALIRRCLESRLPGEVTAVVTFEPLPQAFLRPQQAPPRIYGAQRKLDLLREAGVELAWVMRFDRELASMPAATFAESVLAAGLGARRVLVGPDFRFGHRREGDLVLLANLGRRLGFVVEPADEVRLDGERVSSTLIRKLLAAGNFARAERCLGRPYVLRGQVIRGRQLGRELGYPTANLVPEATPCPHGPRAMHNGCRPWPAWAYGPRSGARNSWSKSIYLTLTAICISGSSKSGLSKKSGTSRISPAWTNWLRK
jgi:riboflavin kinase/FMN adenylyltransferase